MGNRTCTHPDCDRKHFARDLCHMHYKAAGLGFTPKPCTIPGCDQMTTRHTARGLCARHYTNKRRNGTVERTKFYPNQGMTVADVLFERTEPAGDCVHWTGPLRDGYARDIQDPTTGERTKAHRVSWMLAHGPIPDDLQLDHECHTFDPSCPGGVTCLHRRCVNPDHLAPVTGPENTARAWAQRRAHLAMMD